MKKLNIAEILKDCPSGTKLYSTVHGEMCLEAVSTLIKCKSKDNDCSLFFYPDGRWIENRGECILFPSKENRDWSTFQRPFKDGDILTTDLGSIFILKTPDINNFCYGCYVALNDVHRLVINNPRFCVKSKIRFATEEEKQKLFDAIKANGYRWNPEPKTLEKLVNHKFKIGDRVKKNKDAISGTVTDIFDDSFKVTYDNGGCCYVQFHYQCEWELVPNKFDITTLKPFDKVLVRDKNKDKWAITFFSHCNNLETYKHSCIHYTGYAQCIPYEGNENLLDTTNDCDEYYKTWE